MIHVLQSKNEAARSIIPGKTQKPKGKLNRAAYVLRHREKIIGSRCCQSGFFKKIQPGKNRGSRVVSNDAWKIGGMDHKSGFFS